MSNFTSVLDPNIRDNPCYALQSVSGVEYLEFSCLYPGWQKLYAPFEVGYDPVPVLSWMQNHPFMPVITCLAYLVVIFGGQHYLSTRERWNWRFSLGAWNFLLSSFSLIGFLRVLPNLLHNLYYYSLRDNFCQDPRVMYGGGSTGLWVQMFILSKFPELFDTFFIVIHKKPLIFLHWYHHVTVLLYCWHSYVTMSPPGIFFVTMNYMVHSIMYFYYFLMAARMKPKWFNPIIITILQISQMVVGVAVTLIGFYFYKTEKSCMIEAENNTAAFIMYGSYLFLFMQFFLGRYFGQHPPKKQKVV